MNLEAARDAGVDVEINFLSSDEVLKVIPHSSLGFLIHRANLFM